MSISEETKQERFSLFRNLPAYFVQNIGQAHPDMYYYVNGPGYAVAFMSGEVILSFWETSSE